MQRLAFLLAFSLLLFRVFPAAAFTLELSGYQRVYAIYADNDEIPTPAPSDSLREFQWLRYTGLYFTGEEKLDSGAAFGVKVEFKLGNEAQNQGAATLTSAGRDFNQFDEGFAYLSGAYGRVMLGARDGAAYLLQVAAPAADSNVDGMRIYVQGWRSDVWDDGRVNGSWLPANGLLRLGYDNADFGKSERLLYNTPKWNGLQFAFSYAPENGTAAVNDALSGASPDQNTGRFEDHADAALRWDGEWRGVKIAAGAGWSMAGTEIEAAPGDNGSDDWITWNAGLNLGWREWSLGAAYRRSNTGVAGPDADQRVWVVGAGWVRGPWRAGASFYDMRMESNAFSIGLADDLKLRRTTLGGGYTLAPGISLRSSVSVLDADNGVHSPYDPLQTMLLFGTDIAF